MMVALTECMIIPLVAVMVTRYVPGCVWNVTSGSKPVAFFPFGPSVSASDEFSKGDAEVSPTARPGGLTLACSLTVPVKLLMLSSVIMGGWKKVLLIGFGRMSVFGLAEMEKSGRPPPTVIGICNGIERPSPLARDRTR